MAICGLFIGIDRFADPKIRELTGCKRDALALSSLFCDTIPELSARILLDDQATASAIRDALNATFSEASAADTIVVSLSSHGTHDHRLVAHDTSLADLAATTINMDELAVLFKTTAAKIVVCILDCCFSGGAPARVLEDSPALRSPSTPFEAIAGSGRILIAASGINEPALELNRHGLLTFALIEALQAAEPTVSITSAMDAVMNRVRVEATRQGHQQNPVLFGFVEGGLVFPSLRRGKQFFNAFPELKGLRVSGKFEDLVGFGLPQKLITIWQQLFPAGLNDLQLQAINEHRILDGQSVFVVAPTSSGKTFVGELAAAKAIVDGRKAVFLFPYKALVNEKFDQFCSVYGDGIGMRVIRCTGDYLDQTNAFVLGKFDLAVLTYEMFLSLSVANPAVVDGLGLLVVDETQFISDPKRGIVVELLLTNVLAAKDRGIQPQIVTLSAVIGGENGFDTWLGSSKLVTRNRPVPLIEGVLDREGAYRYVDELGQQKTQQLVSRMSIVQRRDKPSSQDVIVPLVRQLLKTDSNERIIVFRNGRGSTEGCAQYLANELGLPPATDVIDLLPSTDLSTSSQSLRSSLQGGTAFHNSNLNRDERMIVERSFRKKDGEIKVLAATTTVAAGINTPASTVIVVEHQFFGDDVQRPFTVAEYKNMSGRAGRLGFHEVGRSILLAETPMQAHTLFHNYVVGSLTPLSSSFDPNHIETWLLRLLSQVKKIPRTSVVKLLASTYGGYLAGNSNPNWHDRTVSRLTTLLTQMIQLGLVEEELENVSLTLLGRACGRSALAFESAMRLVRVLRTRSASPLLTEELMIAIQALPELDGIHTPVMKRGQAESRWPRELAIKYGSSLAMSLQNQAGDNWTYYARCKRAMVLGQWIAGTPVETIERDATTNSYQGKISAGHIVGFADATRFYLRSAAQIAAVMLLANAPDEAVVDMFLKQLEVGLPANALGLLELPLVLTRGEYLSLFAAGVRTVGDVWASSLDQLIVRVGKNRAKQLNALRPVSA